MKKSSFSAKRRVVIDPEPDVPKSEPPAKEANGPKGEAAEPGVPGVLPILPVRNLVVFPDLVLPLSVGREESMRLLDENLPKSKIIGAVTQRVSSDDNPGPDDLYGMGTAVSVMKLIRENDGGALVVLRGLQRFVIRKVVQSHPYVRAEVEVVRSTWSPTNEKEWEAEVKNLRQSVIQLMKLTPEASEHLEAVVLNIEDPGHLADFVASTISLDPGKKQVLLEELDVVKRVRMVQKHVSSQLEIAHIQERLQQDVNSQFTDMQRRAYLREQIKAIQRELGDTEDGVEEQVEQLRTQLKEARPPEAVLTQAERELKRLGFVPPASSEFSVIVSYIETLAELPWSTLSKDDLSLDRAQEVLDRDHFDLEKVKRRLIEDLAVRTLNPEGRGPILCFVGPPGVGKTSLGQSIADALGRKFSRISLGGMHDEAEIRGHRRTYVGSMPGQVIQELRRTGTRNPVMMLDEIDKLGADFRGDPASALLEVLDPRQNQTFVDHYLDVPFDLSQILFIATANSMDYVPAALRDRMEVLELAGYTDREKLEIAKRYLVKRQLKENGLKKGQCTWTVAALSKVIEDYTREAGVRGLERQIGSVCRAVAAQVAKGEIKGAKVSVELVEEHLGAPKYMRESRLKTSQPGVVTGLAYTPAGGEVLYVEATRYPGRGNLTLTGQIGDVMKESAQTALSLVRTRAEELGIAEDAFKGTDIHIHVPSGAVPKDGPSAGVAMFTALASLFTDTPVRASVAMTGEVTLRGVVLPIGGLKEKTLAAVRAGVSEVVIPTWNEKDLSEVPEEVRKKLKFTLAETVDDVLAAALGRRRKAGAVSGSGEVRKGKRASKA